MWGGQDSMEPQQLWGTPGHSQNAWTNGGTNHSMNYPPRPQQWPNQMSMQPQWGYQQPPQQPPQWHMPPQQQMGWSNPPNTGYAGYEDKKMSNNRGYSGYGYGGVPQSMTPQQPTWHGQRDMYQRPPWDNAPRGHNNSGNGQWSGGGASSQWQNDWQSMRESDVGSGSPGIGNQGVYKFAGRKPLVLLDSNNVGFPMGFDTWPSTQSAEEATMWRDPKPKKKIRDTGVQVWGDPNSQMDKILRWKEADHEEFQKGPSSSTWNQLLFGLLNASSSPVVEGGNPWAEQSDSSWPANVWESSEAVLAEDSEPRALHYSDDSLRGFGSKADFTNPVRLSKRSKGVRSQTSSDMTDPTVFALQNAFQRALATGLLPTDMKKHPLDQKLKIMVNTLLQKMVKEEQAETELEHIRQIMARGDYPVTVAQEHERISNERDGFKTEITILSDEIKNTVQGSSWLHQWQKRNTSNDGLSAALQSMGIEDTPKIPNPAPWAEGPALAWNDPAPISVNTDLDRPSKLEESSCSDRKSSGPQEFIPGKKWEWNDPAKVAEDPNATPGSVKPSFASPSWGNGNCDPWSEKKGDEKKPSVDEAPEK